MRYVGIIRIVNHGLVIALNNADVNGTKVAPFANQEISFMVVGLQLMKIGWVNLSVQKQETRFRGYWVITMRY